ncbi:MAG TPA: formate dehydrogenase accessory sulfurtransferase FdhD [Methylophilaceae bacterium]|nr:formate dehydrogenase accessory sulfurtransferase FdhD [Methylophilaceae bacterium]
MEGEVESLSDCIAEEVPVALIYNGISHAVMLATPQDLSDFALGFSLSEGILSSPSELYDIEVVNQPKGIELHLDIASGSFAQLKERRRSMTGRTGCGLCGAESLEQALRLPETVINSDQQFEPEAIFKALKAIQDKQVLQGMTGATHASAWVKPDGEIVMVREDVGRHNALDKLLGARAKVNPEESGFVLTTSRASYEMVQKVAVANIAMLVAISAPTGLAIRIAQSCGITLVGFARSHQHVIYSRADRILHKELA